MLFDRKVMFCDDEAIVANGDVGDVINLNDPNLDLHIGEQTFIGIVVTEALVATGTGVVFTIKTEATEGGSFDNNLIVSREYLKAEFIPGAEFKLPIPDGCEQFIKITSVVNTPTAGKMTAGFVG